MARAHRAPYDKIWEALEELEAISHPNEKQVQIQEVLWTMAMKAHGGRTRSKLPARTASHGQEAQSQRRSAFERLGPNGSQNQEKRRDHAQSNQVEYLREERSRASCHSSPWFLPRLNDSWQGGLSQNIEKPECMTSFPIFQDGLLQYDCLTSSSRQTTSNMMERPNQGSGSESTRNQLN
jgi:hypothetical protein